MAAHDAVESMPIFRGIRNQDIERVTIGVDGSPQPVLHAVHLDHDLVEVPFVVRLRPVPADASRKMRTKPVHPKADGFAADDDAALRQQILDIRRAQRKAMKGPDRIGDDLAGKTKALRARHL